MKRVLVTGGAGFVGSNLCTGLAAKHPDWNLTALDNLHRRGSELNLPRLREAGVGFIEADVREPDALASAGTFDALIECSAEPSVMAGTDGETSYAVHTNISGAYNCLEAARAHKAAFLFLSTSRVYPIAPQRALRTIEADTRLELSPDQEAPGASAAGISEEFPMAGPRSLYGATKLAAELLIEEYAEAFGMQTIVNRCGVIAGPWQMGKADQGVFAFWLLGHLFGLPLRYIGYGGAGKQVRDLLHVEDLLELVDEQLGDLGAWAGFTGNVGGGREVSLSLAEATEICRELTGTRIEVGSEPAERAGDVPIYLSDCSRLFARTDWRPRRAPREILGDIHAWASGHREELAEALGIDKPERVGA